MISPRVKRFRDRSAMGMISFPQDDLAGFEQRFQVRKNLWPSPGNSCNQLRLRALDRVRDREAHGGSDGLQVHGAEAEAFGLEFRPELVAPLELNPLRPVEFENFPRIRYSPIGEEHSPLRPLFPFRLDMHSEPVLFHLLWVGQRGPEFLRSCADKCDVYETALECRAHDSFSSRFFFSVESA